MAVSFEPEFQVATRSGWAKCFWRPTITLGMSGLLCLSAVSAPSFAFGNSRKFGVGEIVQGSLYNGKFKELDAFEAQLLTDRTRTPDGEFVLDQFYGIFDHLVFDRRSYQPHGSFAVKHLEKWFEERPNSQAAHLAMAIYFKNHGQQLRRRVNPNGAPAIGINRPEVFLSSGENLLNVFSLRFEAHPHMYVIGLEIDALRGATELKLLSYHALAVKIFPDYHPINYAVLDQLVARAKASNSAEGSRRLIKDFAESVLTYGGSEHGPVNYARLYMRLFHKHLKMDVLNYAGVSWPALRTGLEQITERYPTRGNKNIAALFACLAGDRQTARRYWPSNSKEVSKKIWKEPMIYRACQDWLQGIVERRKL